MIEQPVTNQLVMKHVTNGPACTTEVNFKLCLNSVFVISFFLQILIHDAEVDDYIDLEVGQTVPNKAKLQLSRKVAFATDVSIAHIAPVTFDYNDIKQWQLLTSMSYVLKHRITVFLLCAVWCLRKKVLFHCQGFSH